MCYINYGTLGKSQSVQKSWKQNSHNQQSGTRLPLESELAGVANYFFHSLILGENAEMKKDRVKICNFALWQISARLLYYQQ